MSYLPGTYIDLRYLNKKKEVATSRKKSETGSLFDVGTQFIFSFAEGQLKAARRIQVAMA